MFVKGIISSKNLNFVLEKREKYVRHKIIIVYEQ